MTEAQSNHKLRGSGHAPWAHLFTHPPPKGACASSPTSSTEVKTGRIVTEPWNHQVWEKSLRPLSLTSELCPYMPHIHVSVDSEACSQLQLKHWHTHPTHNCQDHWSELSINFQLLFVIKTQYHMISNCRTPLGTGEQQETKSICKNITTRRSV